MAESATSVGSLTFLGLFAMFSLSPSFYFLLFTHLTSTRPGTVRANAPASSKPVSHLARRVSAAVRRLVPPHPETSYWQGGANEMAAINTILIIVNSRMPQGLTSPQNSHAPCLIGASLRPKNGELAAVRP